jgi:MEDS: MEthanogen/methylotroph, DcmR Sensory domain
MTETVELGIPGLVLDVGDHVCAFYRGADEHDEILRSYVAVGLRSGDKCICVLDDGDPDVLRAALGEAADGGGPGDGQLDVRLSQQTYLRGGRFSTSAMLAFWDDVVGAAFEGGYQFSRAVGEMSWALRQMPGVEELVRYEAELNSFLPRYPQVVLCLYDLDLFNGEILVDILKTHPTVLVRGMVLDNPYYLEPTEFLAARQ